jgi:hypothetical protein
MRCMCEREVIMCYVVRPGQVGFGVDVVTGKRELPVVALTYDMDSAAHTFTDNQGSKFALPMEATFTPIYGGGRLALARLCLRNRLQAGYVPVVGRVPREA